jgi:RNA-directed DNA polymerase
MKKWYSLIDKIYRKENLELAFRKVKRNHGAPGIDGETVLDFNEALETNIEFLHEKLKTNTLLSSKLYTPNSTNISHNKKGTG